LKCTDAITSDGGKKAVGVIALGLHAHGKAATDLVVIGQQIIENRHNRLAHISVFP
jgi:hypothetical protein